MADKQSGLLVTLGKRLLGFSTSSSCCATPTATEEVKQPEPRHLTTKTVEVVTPDPKATGASCCAPTCCSADTPADARRA
jgi:hypothetical protein